MTSLQRDSCLLALGLQPRNCSASSVKPPTSTSGGLMPLGLQLQLQCLLVPQTPGSLLAQWRALLTGEKLQGKLALSKQLKTISDPVALLKSNLPQTINGSQRKILGLFFFIAWFVLYGSEFNSCSWELKKFWKNVILVKKKQPTPPIPPPSSLKYTRSSHPIFSEVKNVHFFLTFPISWGMLFFY